MSRKRAPAMPDDVGPIALLPPSKRNPLLIKTPEDALKHLRRGFVQRFPWGTPDRVSLNLAITALSALTDPRTPFNEGAWQDVLTRLNAMDSVERYDAQTVEDAIMLIRSLLTQVDGLARHTRRNEDLLRATLPYVGEPTTDPQLHALLTEVITAPEPEAKTIPLLPPNWEFLVTRILDNAGVHNAVGVADQLRQALARYAPRTQVPAKAFPAPGRWFPVDVLGNPMREIAPGVWESWTKPHPPIDVTTPPAKPAKKRAGKAATLKTSHRRPAKPPR